jgi:hypothetical protein
MFSVSAVVRLSYATFTTETRENTEGAQRKLKYY